MINRRGLLSLIGLAPIAAPAIASAPAVRLASGGYVHGVAGSLLVGEAAGVLLPPSDIMTMEIDPDRVSRAIQRGLSRLNIPVVDETLGFVDGDGI